LRPRRAGTERRRRRPTEPAGTGDPDRSKSAGAGMGQRGGLGAGSRHTRMGCNRSGGRIRAGLSRRPSRCTMDRRSSSAHRGLGRGDRSTTRAQLCLRRAWHGRSAGGVLVHRALGGRPARRPGPPRCRPPAPRWPGPYPRPAGHGCNELHVAVRRDTQLRQATGARPVRGAGEGSRGASQHRCSSAWPPRLVGSMACRLRRVPGHSRPVVHRLRGLLRQNQVPHLPVTCWP
ncbi:MAG: hypothetical protein QOH37_1100, partial [Nocardioidaceae bacterium]|nr:hypothetical protein [Nocardioidaceae bacterium]